jgi:hypothetical protein
VLRAGNVYHEGNPKVTTLRLDRKSRGQMPCLSSGQVEVQ